LRLGEMPEPEVRDHDVLIAIHAASLNPLDAKIRDGEFKLICHPVGEAPRRDGGDHDQHGECRLVRSLGADVVIDYRNRISRKS
jgi:hypothetical protein